MKLTRCIRCAVLPLLVMVFCSFTAQGDEASEQSRGLNVARGVDEADSGFGSFEANVVMVIDDGKGHASERSLSIRVLEGQNEGDRNLTIVHEPRNVSGTALLSHAQKVGNDDQWLYLPALGRVKRISSSNRSGAFMGSEFAYEDMTAQELEKFEYRYIDRQIMEGRLQHRVERIPVYEGSGYKRQIMWVDDEHQRISRVDFFDRRDQRLKTLTFEGFKKYGGQYWRPDIMLMSNHQNGRRTRLEWSDYDFRSGLNDSDFSVAALRRAR